MEYTMLDKKGKEEQRMVHRIAAVDNTQDGLAITVETKIDELGGDENFEGNYTVLCQEGVLKMDVTSFLPPEMKSSFEQSMDVEIEGNGLEIPPSLEAGQTLPDATTIIKMKTGGFNLMNMTFTQENRKVVSQETVETPSGTYQAHKLTYEMNIKTIMKKSYQVSEWYAEGIGVVKSETYNKKGKLQSSMVLSALEKP